MEITMKPIKPWTATDFKMIVGREPEQDDLERVNCNSAGKLGHECCGVCEHGYPKSCVCKKCQDEKDKPIIPFFFKLHSGSIPMGDGIVMAKTAEQAYDKVDEFYKDNVRYENLSISIYHTIL